MFTYYDDFAGDDVVGVIVPVILAVAAWKQLVDVVDASSPISDA